MAVERVLAGYHIARRWPSTCGTGLIFMQDMVGDGDANSRSRGADRVRAVRNLTLLQRKRARGKPGAGRTHGLARVTRGSSHHRYNRAKPGLPRAMVLRLP